MSRSARSNWVDRGDSVELPLARLLAIVFHRDPVEHEQWLLEHARAVFGMVAANASEVAVAGYLNSVARELDVDPGEIKARSTAAALWHVAKVALLREELRRLRSAYTPQSRAEQPPLNEFIAAALLSEQELALYLREPRATSPDDASR